MKLPEEAWLEFKLESGNSVQTATFRTFGLVVQSSGIRHYRFIGLFLKKC
jgi:hypothetical protein